MNGNGNGSSKWILGVIGTLAGLGVAGAIRSEITSSNFTGRMEERMAYVEREQAQTQDDVKRLAETIQDLDKIADRLDRSVIDINQLLKKER